MSISLIFYLLSLLLQLSLYIACYVPHTHTFRAHFDGNVHTPPCPHLSTPCIREESSETLCNLSILKNPNPNPNPNPYMPSPPFILDYSYWVALARARQASQDHSRLLLEEDRS